MIKGFDKETEQLNDYELHTLVPLLIRGLSARIGKSRAVTNKFIVQSMRNEYKITEARVRKIINYIRNNDLVTCLIATSDGYYVAENEKELKEYEDSLLGREEAIRAVRLSINRQRKLRFGGTQQTLFDYE